MGADTLDQTIGLLDAADSVPAAIGTFETIIAERGGIGFIAIAMDSDEQSRMLLYTSLHEPFTALDAQGPWWSDDPIMAWLIEGRVRPFRHEDAWANPLPSAAPRWEVMKAAGLDSGITFPTSRPPYSGAVLVFAGADEAERALLERSAHELHILCSYFHARIVDFTPTEDVEGIIRNTLFTEEFAGRKYKLSKRECDCLRWLALGKTARDIADIESLSVFTVRSYLRSAMEKLDASSQPQAVAQALRYGLIRV